MCIRVEIPLNPHTNANDPRMSKIHTFVLPPLSFTLINSEGRLADWIYRLTQSERKSNCCILNPSRLLAHNGSRAWKPWEWTLKTIPAVSNRRFGKED